MALFFLRLIPPRPSFPSDMTESEAAVMKLHVNYWQNLLDRGAVVAFGPIFEPAGPWGLGIIQAEGEAEARALAEADPAISGHSGFRFDLFPTQLRIAHSHHP